MCVCAHVCVHVCAHVFACLYINYYKCVCAFTLSFTIKPQQSQPQLLDVYTLFDSLLREKKENSLLRSVTWSKRQDAFPPLSEENVPHVLLARL